MAERKARWRDAAIGSALVALGGAIFSVTRGSAKPAAKVSGKSGAKRRESERDAKPMPSPRLRAGRPQVRTAPNPPEVTGRTQYWPPPPPPSPDVYDDGIRPAEQTQETKPLPIDRQSEKLGYEALDAKPGTIVKVMLSFAFVIVCSIAGLFYLIGGQRRDDVRGAPLTPQQLAVIVPPGPHLQDHPIHDIAMENKREFDLLKYYAWSGPNHRSGRIPIARAEALVIGRPLDPLPAPAPPAANP